MQWRTFRCVHWNKIVAHMVCAAMRTSFFLSIFALLFAIEHYYVYLSQFQLLHFAGFFMMFFWWRKKMKILFLLLCFFLVFLLRGVDSVRFDRHRHDWVSGEKSAKATFFLISIRRMNDAFVWLLRQKWREKTHWHCS